MKTFHYEMNPLNLSIRSIDPSWTIFASKLEFIIKLLIPAMVTSTLSPPNMLAPNWMFSPYAVCKKSNRL